MIKPSLKSFGAQDPVKLHRLIYYVTEQETSTSSGKREKGIKMWLEKEELDHTESREESGF